MKMTLCLNCLYSTSGVDSYDDEHATDDDYADVDDYGGNCYVIDVEQNGALGIVVVVDYDDDDDDDDDDGYDGPDDNVAVACDVDDDYDAMKN
jgi:hypothetical protein